MKLSRREFGMGSAAAVTAACGVDVDSGANPEALGERSDAFHINYGSWRVVGIADSLAIHAVLTPFGKIVYWGGSQHDPNYPFGSTDVRVWDYNGGGFSAAASVPNNIDLFCSGHILTPSGLVMVVGGNESYPQNVTHFGEPHFGGLRSTLYYNAVSNTWSQGANMPRGRWYPSVGISNSSDMIALSGHPHLADPLHFNADVNLRTLDSTAPWGSMDPLSQDGFYPRIFTDSHTHVSFNYGGKNKFRNVNTWADWGNANFNENIYNSLSSSGAMLPITVNASTGLWNRGRVMLTNGVQPIWKTMGGSATSNWTNTPARPQPWAGVNPTVRNHAIATLLPTGDVFVSGGVVNPSSDGSNGTTDTSVYYSEIFRNDLQVWHVAQLASVHRNYHSVAILQPNGSVWTAGGNNNAGFSQTNQPNGNGRELGIEIFEPWYTQVARPTITNAPSTLQAATNPNFNVSIQTWAGAPNVTKAILLAPGSTTHAFNYGQRYIELHTVSSAPLSGANGRVLTVRAPTWIQRGYYMLFALMDSGGHPAGSQVPSVGRWIRFT